MRRSTEIFFLTLNIALFLLTVFVYGAILFYPAFQLKTETAMTSFLKALPPILAVGGTTLLGIVIGLLKKADTPRKWLTVMAHPGTTAIIFSTLAVEAYAMALVHWGTYSITIRMPAGLPEVKMRIFQRDGAIQYEDTILINAGDTLFEQKLPFEGPYAFKLEDSVYGGFRREIVKARRDTLFFNAERKTSKIKFSLSPARAELRLLSAFPPLVNGEEAKFSRLEANGAVLPLGHVCLSVRCQGYQDADTCLNITNQSPAEIVKSLRQVPAIPPKRLLSIKVSAFWQGQDYTACTEIFQVGKGKISSPDNTLTLGIGDSVSLECIRTLEDEVFYQGGFRVTSKTRKHKRVDLRMAPLCKVMVQSSKPEVEIWAGGKQVGQMNRRDVIQAVFLRPGRVRLWVSPPGTRDESSSREMFLANCTQGIIAGEVRF